MCTTYWPLISWTSLQSTSQTPLSPYCYPSRPTLTPSLHNSHHRTYSTHFLSYFFPSYLKLYSAPYSSFAAFMNQTTFSSCCSAMTCSPISMDCAPGKVMDSELRPLCMSMPGCFAPSFKYLNWPLLTYSLCQTFFYYFNFMPYSNLVFTILYNLFN